MKKNLIIIFLCLLFSAGCFNKSSTGDYKKLKKHINKANGYIIKGELQIANNDDTYKYDVKVDYKDKNYFRVSLKNKTNDHEQVILKNDEGVFVLTPALNKSFKFQSDWPYNNSQSYILQNIINDIENDKNRTKTTSNNQTIITTKVNYMNNSKLKKQKIYLNKNSDISKVEVLNDNNDIVIKMTYSKITYKNDNNKKYFQLGENIKISKTTKTLEEIEDVLYPMNIPSNTYLQSQDKVNLKDGERIILTFAGDKSFTLVEETANVSKEVETIPVSGDPIFLMDTIGNINDNSINWISNGIEYYATSNTMNNVELLEVVNSISNNAIEK